MGLIVAHDDDERERRWGARFAPLNEESGRAARSERKSASPSDRPGTNLPCPGLASDCPGSARCCPRSARFCPQVRHLISAGEREVPPRRGEDPPRAPLDFLGESCRRGGGSASPSGGNTSPSGGSAFWSEGTVAASWVCATLPSGAGDGERSPARSRVAAACPRKHPRGALPDRRRAPRLRPPISKEGADEQEPIRLA